MTRRMIRLVLVVSAAGMAAAPRGANAQFPGAPATGTGMMNGASVYANPITNPYMNPFMNPFMTQSGTMSPGNALMFMYAANQANGGIGSGQLSGVRPGPGAGPGARGGARGAGTGKALATPAYEQDPQQRVSDTPGASAAHYFNRGASDTQRTGRYYNRSGRYYGNIGR